MLHCMVDQIQEPALLIQKQQNICGSIFCRLTEEDVERTYTGSCTKTQCAESKPPAREV